MENLNVYEFILALVFLLLILFLFVLAFILCLKHELILNKKKQDFIHELEDIDDVNAICAIKHYIHIKVTLKELFSGINDEKTSEDNKR